MIPLLTLYNAEKRYASQFSVLSWGYPSLSCSLFCISLGFLLKALFKAPLVFGVPTYLFVILHSSPQKKSGPWVLICVNTWQDPGGKFSLKSLPVLKEERVGSASRSGIVIKSCDFSSFSSQKSIVLQLLTNILRANTDHHSKY